jgi:hypothetical protein
VNNPRLILEKVCLKNLAPSQKVGAKVKMKVGALFWRSDPGSLSGISPK